MTSLRPLLTITCFSLLAAFLLAQGDLNPPGPPEPTMKTLQQVEPRIDLATVPSAPDGMHWINQPGSYYLSANLDVTTLHGIDITTSDVTIDLNGFSIFRSSGSAATGTAILLRGNGMRDITIMNGHITGGVTYSPRATGDQFTGPGFSSGILEIASTDPINVRVSRVHVSGCDLKGIDLSSSEAERSNTVEHCSVRVVGGIGIRAGEVHHSTAITCGDTAIVARGNVTSSRGLAVGTGDGIEAGGNVSDSYGEASTSNGDDGIDARNVSNSIGITAARMGIVASANVTNSFGETTGDQLFSDGIATPYTISYSRGESTGGSLAGEGLRCAVAVGCTAAGGETIANKFLMP